VIQCKEGSEENAATRKERGKVEEWKLSGVRVLQSLSHCLVKREKKRRGNILVEGMERKGDLKIVKLNCWHLPFFV
jgi:hypothetical protein